MGYHHTPVLFIDEELSKGQGQADVSHHSPACILRLCSLNNHSFIKSYWALTLPGSKCAVDELQKPYLRRVRIKREGQSFTDILFHTMTVNRVEVIIGNAASWRNHMQIHKTILVSWVSVWFGVSGRSLKMFFWALPSSHTDHFLFCFIKDRTYAKKGSKVSVQLRIESKIYTWPKSTLTDLPLGATLTGWASWLPGQAQGCHSQSQHLFTLRMYNNRIVCMLFLPSHPPMLWCPLLIFLTSSSLKICPEM